MTPGDAKRFIKQHFQARHFADNVGDGIDGTTFASALAAIDHLIPFRDARDNEDLGRFLWSGCKKFDRWMAPSPYIVDVTQSEDFARFVSAFARIEAGNETNAQIFRVHAVRDQLWALLNKRPLPLPPEVVTGELSKLEADLAGIPPPTNATKAAEFDREVAIVREIINASVAADLVSICVTHVPYPLVKQPTTVKVAWRGISTEVKLSSSFSPPPELQLVRTDAPTVLASALPSRWQFGTTRIECKFRALIDHSIRVDPLQMPREGLPVEGWPSAFRLVFELVYEVLWRIRNQSSSLGAWVISPADIGEVEFWMSSPRDTQIGWIRKSNPALLGFAFNPADAEVQLVADDVEPTQWHEKCRVLAEQYLSIGDTREALFWLNVGVEHLLDQRMRAILAEGDKNIGIDDLIGGPTYWDEAKSIVATQFPDVAEKIDWPKASAHVSMFRRIKYFAKHVPLAISAGDALAAYATIQRDRNKLFHGANEERIKPESAIAALRAFEALMASFRTATSATVG